MCYIHATQAIHVSVRFSVFAYSVSPSDLDRLGCVEILCMDVSQQKYTRPRANAICTTQKVIISGIVRT